MYVGNSNQGMWQLFTGMNQSRTNKNNFFASRVSPRKSNAGGRNTLEDFLSGHRKNSYGVEGMGVTGRTDCNRIIPVSAEMKELVFNRVKDSFYKYNGMSGDNENELDVFYGKQNAYFKTLEVKDRAAASWTLQQLRSELCQSVTNAVKEKVSGWTVGKPISKDILDEIFADEKFTSMLSGKSSKANGLDIKV